MKKNYELKKITNGFIDINFPEDIACGSSGGPEYLTSVAMSAGGHEQRNANWSNPRMRFNVVPGVKNQEQLYELISFFRLCQGKAFGFRFKDWSDYQAEDEKIGVSDGQTEQYQLCKWYLLETTKPTMLSSNRISSESKDLQLYTKTNTDEGEESNTEERRGKRREKGLEKQLNRSGELYAKKRLIYKPQLGSVAIFADGARLKPGEYRVDYSTGVVILAKVLQPGVEISADFRFDVPVRFDIDYLPVKTESVGLYIHAEIPLVELRI